MKNLAWIEKLTPVLFLGLLIAAVGCGETATTDTAPSNPPTGVQSTDQQASAEAAPLAPKAPSAPTASSLTGAWMGRAVMDQEKLRQKISQLDPETQKDVSLKAKRFLSMAMAMEFRENGTVQNEVEILSTEGKMVRGGSVAQWHVMESSPHALLVQVRERLKDGTISSGKMYYQFSADRNQIAIHAPVTEELQGCDAMIVFNRRTLPPANVAARPTETMAK